MANQNLKITLTAFDKTRRAFSAVSKGLGKIGGLVLNVKTALVGLAGVGGFGLLIRSSLQSIDTLGKTASKLGVTTEELGALRFAAKISGVEIRTTDMAVQRFTRRLSEAAVGTGEAQNALKELNIDAEQLQNLTLQEQMLVLADRFGEVKTEADKVRLAFKLFDSEGVAFVNILKQGSNELKGLFEEADSLGILLSGSAVQGVEKANDAVTKLFTLFKGVRDQIVSALAPALEHLATILKDKILDSIKGSNDNVSAFGRTLSGEFLEAIKQVIVAFQSFFNGMIKIINSVGEFAVFGRRMFKSFEKIKEINIDFKIMDDLIRKVGTAQKDVATNTKKSVEAMTTMQQIIEGLSKGVKEYGDNVKTLKEISKDVATRGLKSLEDALVNIMMQTQSVKDAFKDMARSIIADIIRIGIQRQIVAPIADALFPERANGGQVVGGKPYMVGERGAELFVPGRSGTIIPNDQLAKGGSQPVVVNQTINLSTGVSQTVRAEVLNMLPQISEAAKGAVLDAKRRGGQFSSAFGV